MMSWSGGGISRCARNSIQMSFNASLYPCHLPTRARTHSYLQSISWVCVTKSTHNSIALSSGSFSKRNSSALSILAYGAFWTIVLHSSIQFSVISVSPTRGFSSFCTRRICKINEFHFYIINILPAKMWYCSHNYSLTAPHAKYLLHWRLHPRLRCLPFY